MENRRSPGRSVGRSENHFLKHEQLTLDRFPIKTTFPKCLFYTVFIIIFWPRYLGNEKITLLTTNWLQWRLTFNNAAEALYIVSSVNSVYKILWQHKNQNVCQNDSEYKVCGISKEVHGLSSTTVNKK